MLVCNNYSRGSFATLALAALLFVICATGFGLLASTFTRSQIAAMFVTMIGTIIPCVQFAGLLNPVSSLEGFGASSVASTRPRIS